MAEAFLGPLCEALSLDLAYVRVNGSAAIAFAAAPGCLLAAASAAAVGEQLDAAVAEATPAPRCRIAEVCDGADLRVAMQQVAGKALIGGASRRRDFPTALERELLGIAAQLFAGGLERIAAERAHRRQTVQRAVAQVFASARTTADATAGILRAVCGNLEWTVGAIWLPDRQLGELRCVDLWHVPGRAVPTFEAGSRQRTFRPGVGLPGRVWQSGRPAWIPDVTRDGNFPRASMAATDGLHAAFGFPMRLGDEVLGVIEFFSERMQEPDEDLLGMMATVGVHLGQFLDRSRANETLLESEQRFARFMHHIPGLAWLKDADGRYVYANDRAVEAFRTPRARLYGSTDEDIFPPEIAAQFKHNDRTALSSPGGVQVIETLQHADGIVHHSLATKFRVADPEASRSMVGGIALDITDQLRTAEAFRASEERLALAVQEAGMATWDLEVPTGKAIWSETHFRILGYEPVPGGAASHELFLARIHPEDRERVVATLAEARRAGSPYRLEHRVIRADNGEVRWLSTFGRFRGEESERFVGVMFDNTERRRAEDALREADRRKDEFLALLAHELRNPLAPIRNASHLLRVGSRDPAEIDRIQQLLERQVRHLVRLVDDLLEVSRASRGRLELRKTRVDLKEVVASAIETTRASIDASRHRLSVALPSGPVFLHADAVRLTQVLANLLHNATKYTDEGGQIGVALELAGDSAVVRVRDTGIGIPHALLQRIFDMFIQGDNLGRSESGLGIGLTIAKSLVELHGGTIEATSGGPGTGAEFVVRLPLVAAPEAPAPATTGPGGEPAVTPASRVLIVDDNRDSSESLALILRRMGMDIRIANDGASALRAIDSFAPEAVLLDIAMPGMDGYEVARRIRAQATLDRVALVALTGFAQEADRERCRRAGFDAHLVKPADPEALAALLTSITGRASAGATGGRH